MTAPETMSQGRPVSQHLVLPASEQQHTLQASRCTASPGSIAISRLPQLAWAILSETAAPTRGPASSSTISARWLPL